MNTTPKPVIGFIFRCIGAITTVFLTCLILTFMTGVINVLWETTLGKLGLERDACLYCFISFVILPVGAAVGIILANKIVLKTGSNLLAVVVGIIASVFGVVLFIRGLPSIGINVAGTTTFLGLTLAAGLFGTIGYDIATAQISHRQHIDS